MSKRVKRSVKPKSLRSSFTWYIPAPPGRKSGYREKEFDKILTGIMQSGFQIESLQTQAVGNENGAGLFIIAILKAPTAAVAKLDLGQEIHEKFRLTHTHSSPDIILDSDDEFNDEM